MYYPVVDQITELGFQCGLNHKSDFHPILPNLSEALEVNDVGSLYVQSHSDAESEFELPNEGANKNFFYRPRTCKNKGKF